MTNQPDPEDSDAYRGRYSTLWGTLVIIAFWAFVFSVVIFAARG